MYPIATCTTTALDFWHHSITNIIYLLIVCPQHREDITLLLRKHVDEVIKFVENGFCQIAVQQEGFNLGVGGRGEIREASYVVEF